VGWLSPRQSLGHKLKASQRVRRQHPARPSLGRGQSGDAQSLALAGRSQSHSRAIGDIGKRWVGPESETLARCTPRRCKIQKGPSTGGACRLKNWLAGCSCLVRGLRCAPVDMRGQVFGTQIAGRHRLRAGPRGVGGVLPAGLLRPRRRRGTGGLPTRAGRGSSHGCWGEAGRPPVPLARRLRPAISLAGWLHCLAA